MSNQTLLCEACVTDQHHQTFSLWQGLNETHKQQLLNFSKNDPLITQNTGDQVRFANAVKLNDWLASQRIVYALTPQNNPNELSGLFWFSPEKLPLETDDQRAKNSQWTLGIRLYESARGNRLSLPFMTKAFAYFWQKYPEQSVWLTTNQTNQVSQKIYAQFGFQQLGQKGGKLFYIVEPKEIIHV